ncbi:hypothetical protein SE17_10230 [Kouleothrix aurantiaca]|jgi:hypothetical protein|uniref:Uncharacterized protein n=1 Tax=Kouleothrix aurantiaca TaxID=186479 RepID=A0A0P9DT34_9CHLR|nr:hypothetical protein SE17_10230 [Kouleothrix aurantiaca]
MNYPIRDTDYESYLLRLWRSGASTGWHASLQSTATEQTYQFATLEALFTFLSSRLRESDAIAVLAPAPPEA